MDITRLIEEVRKRPALWDQGNQHRHNRDVLEAQWEEVGAVFNAPPDDVRKKWKGLRDTFRKELRKYPNGFDQDLSEDEFPQWVFFKQLMFLKRQMRPRRGDTSAANGFHFVNLLGKEEGDEDTGDLTLADQAEMMDHEPLEPIVACSTLRELGARPMKRPAPDPEPFVDDEDYHFFMSLVPHVRKLAPVRKLQLRARLQELVCSEVYGEPKQLQVLDPSHVTVVDDEQQPTTSARSSVEANGELNIKREVVD